VIKHYVILADVFQTLRYFEYWTNFSVREEVQNLRHLQMQIAHVVCEHQSMKIHNCRCGTRAAHTIYHVKWECPTRVSCKLDPNYCSQDVQSPIQERFSYVTVQMAAT
jgi:hypothetical protein